MYLFLQSNFSSNKVPRSLPNYYVYAIKAWRNLKNDKVNNCKDLFSQFIWYNKCVLIDKHTLYSESLLRCGLWYVTDLYNDNNEIIPFTTWLQRGAKQKDYTLWRGIISAIPRSWKFLLHANDALIHENQPFNIICHHNEINLKEITQKHVKQYIQSEKFNSLKQGDWKAKIKYASYHGEISDVLWSDIFKIPFNLKIDNRIKEFHFKILHRVIGLNKLLYKMNIVSSPRCYFCFLYNETIEHIFVNCLVVKTFWLSCKKLLAAKYGFDLDVTARGVILHTSHGQIIKNNILNAFTLLGKMYIYYCRCSNLNLEMETFKKYVYH